MNWGLPNRLKMPPNCPEILYSLGPNLKKRVNKKVLGVLDGIVNIEFGQGNLGVLNSNLLYADTKSYFIFSKGPRSLFPPEMTHRT